MAPSCSRVICALWPGRRSPPPPWVFGDRIGRLSSRTVSSTTPDRLVNPDGCAVPEVLRLDEPELERCVQVFEEGHPAAQGDWTDHKAILVDQALARQRLHKRGAAVGHDVLAGLTPQACDLFAELASGDP